MIPTVSIYGLVNPIDGLIFYVGATIQPLSVRLNQHIYAAKNKNSYYGKEKGILIKNILLIGELPLIKLLELVSIEKSSIAERKHYNSLKESGCNLIQHKNHFNYHRNFYIKNINKNEQAS